FFPCPDMLEEFLASEIFAVPHQPFLAQRFLYDRLCGYTRMIGTGQPKHFLAIHPRFSSENVLDSVVQDVAHVEHASNVGRRNDDGVGRLRRAWIGDKTLLLEPEVIPLLLDRLRFVGFGNIRHETRISRIYRNLPNRLDVSESSPKLTNNPNFSFEQAR